MVKITDRIILDTNLWVSFLLTSKFSVLDQLISDKQITLLFSQELLTEFVTVASRPKLRPFFKPKTLTSLLAQIDQHAAFIPVKSRITACRDPKDDFLLNLAIDGNATHLLTGDKDLLDMKHFNKTIILTISEYIQSIPTKHS